MKFSQEKCEKIYHPEKKHEIHSDLSFDNQKHFSGERIQVPGDTSTSRKHEG